MSKGTEFKKALKKIRGGNCIWKEFEDWEDNGNYNTGCDNAFSLIDGTLKSNGFKFCPYCGREIEVNK